MPDLTRLADDAVQFVTEREWAQFHTVKDLAISLNLEAAELLEITQWKDEQALETDPSVTAKLRGELADVLYWLLILSRKTGIDLEEAFAEKMEENRAKYPVDKARGTSKKYTEL